MRKIIVSLFMSVLLLTPLQQCVASDCWYYTDSNGNQSYAVYESVVYGVKTSFYAKVRVKYIDSNGKLFNTQHLEFGRDEGDWWYGRTGVNGDSRRVYDDENATALLQWLREHECEAHRTGNMYEKVLGK